MLTKLHNTGTWRKCSLDNLQHIIYIGCSPHLFSVICTQQENNVLYDDACTQICSAKSSHNVNDNNKAVLSQGNRAMSQLLFLV